jgi:3-hydroxy acid dehydrogenase / malonic semialdehyde reductase
MKKIALVTGASSGIGEATARKFAENGFAVILAARSEDKLKVLAESLQSVTDVHAARLDVTDPASIDAFFLSLPEAFQHIDVLVNNAGLALGLEPAHEAYMEDWETMVQTNIMGLLRVTRRVLPGMVERNAGHVINIGSTAGNWPYPGGNAYGGTKAFVQQFSRGLRSDLRGKAIRVTNIEPGMCETNFSNVRFKWDTEKASTVYQGTQPLSGEDIADIVYWVNSTPAHVNVNTLEVMPVSQTWGPFHIHRE